MFIEYLTFLTCIPKTPNEEVKKLKPEILRLLFYSFLHAYSSLKKQMPLSLLVFS
jgi:hypothetical protein